jgi:hypothetical protein
LPPAHTLGLQCVTRVMPSVVLWSSSMTITSAAADVGQMGCYRLLATSHTCCHLAASMNDWCFGAASCHVPCWTAWHIRPQGLVDPGVQRRCGAGAEVLNYAPPSEQFRPPSEHVHNLEYRPLQATIASTNRAALRIKAALDALEADNQAALRLPVGKLRMLGRTFGVAKSLMFVGSHRHAGCVHPPSATPAGGHCWRLLPSAAMRASAATAI